MQATTHKHILQNGDAIKAEQNQQLEQYKQNAFTDPTLKYLDESLAQRLQGLQPNITAVMPCPLSLASCRQRPQLRVVMLRRRGNAYAMQTGSRFFGRGLQQLSLLPRRI